MPYWFRTDLTQVISSSEAWREGVVLRIDGAWGAGVLRMDDLGGGATDSKPSERSEAVRFDILFARQRLEGIRWSCEL